MTKSIALTDTEKKELTSNIADINKLIIIITKQIMVVQHELSILIGAPYSATFLAVEKIDLVRTFKCFIIYKVLCIIFTGHWRD